MENVTLKLKPKVSEIKKEVVILRSVPLLIVMCCKTLRLENAAQRGETKSFHAFRTIGWSYLGL